MAEKKPKPKLTFDEDRCKGCELCIVVCPRKILKLADHLNVKGYHPSTCIDIDQCTACANCAKMCPDSVIKVEKI